MRITSLSATGVLSYDQFGLRLSERVTFVVGPNGAGKSNLTRLLSVCLRAVESGDGGAGDADRLLAPYLAARHAGSQSPGVEARVAVELTGTAERELVTEFVRAMVTGALTIRHQVRNLAEIDAWAEAQITETELQPLMQGEIVTSHPGTQDGRWQCAYEFTALGFDGSEHTYQWILLGLHAGTVFDVGAPPADQGSDIATRITGSTIQPSEPEVAIPGGFRLLSLLPHPDLSVRGCIFEFSGTPPESQRRFAGLAGLPLFSPGRSRMVSLATVLRVIFRRALVQTSDTRLLPPGGDSWSSSAPAAGGESEARLPELLLRLKNGDPSQRARYQRVRGLFTEFTQGRGCEVRLVQAQQPAQDGQAGTAVQVSAIWVTVNAGAGDLGPEVPAEFAGAGAWEALALASALSEPSASVVVLDEPAVALHPNLQRQLGAHLLSAPAQFLVITHSAELLPLAEAAGVRLVRLDRDGKSATRAWPVDERCRAKVTGKLTAKGNDRLPFAWRAILCEGQDDVGAVMTLAERMSINLRRLNITTADCGSRDSLPDYIWLCSELGLPYLAVMDADSETPAALPKAQAVRDAVNRRRGGELAEFPVNLEKTFKVAKPARGAPSRVPAAIRALPFASGMPDPAQVPPEVTALAEAIRRLTKQP